MIWVHILIGLVLLFGGRSIFWLFVACVGFASGYHCAPQIWAIHSPILLLILAIAVGAVGAIIAILFQKAAIVITGFAAGGYIVLILLDQFAGLSAQMLWLPYIMGGIIGVGATTKLAKASIRSFRITKGVTNEGCQPNLMICHWLPDITQSKRII